MAHARVERNMTQAQLANRLHVAQSMVAMLENNEDLEDEVRYSDKLGQRIKAWIDSGEGAPKKSARGPYKQRNTIKR